MKKLVQTLLMATAMLTSFTACQKKADDFKPTTEAVKTNATVTTKGGSVSIVSATESQFNDGRKILEAGRTDKLDYSQFDLDRMYVAQASGVERKIYVFNELNGSKAMQRALVIYNFDQADAHPVLVEADSKSMVYTDYAEKTQSIVTQGENGVECKTIALDGTTKLFDGNGTAHCIQDAYSNHGWISVWAFVQTAFIPATGAAIAAACALHNM